MRYGIPIVIFCLNFASGESKAQEAIPLPPPDPLPAGSSVQPPGLQILQSMSSVTPAQAPQSAQPAQLPPGVPYPTGPAAGVNVPPYYNGSGPPPGYYGPPPPDYYGPPPGAYRRIPRAIQGDPAGNPNFWFDVEALIWWSRSQPLSVPVVTTGPASQGSNAGNIGAPGTVSLNRSLDYGASGGARMNLGGWFDGDHVWGMEGSLFSIGRQSAGFSVSDHSGAGNYIINEPVVNAPFITQVSAPGIETGAVSVNTTTQFWGGDVNGLFNLIRRDGWSVSLLGGFRYLQLDEHVNIVANSALFTTTTYTDNLGNTLATAPPGSTVTVIDQFGVRNQFYGGQVGFKFQYMADRWSFNGVTSLAIGATHESVTVNGVTNIYPINAQPVSLSGGNYATLQIGRYWEDRFALSPSFQFNVGYQITPFVRATIGYNFILLSNVARPGNQIDNTYDGAVHPLVPLTNTSFWAQGINLGLQVAF